MSTLVLKSAYELDIQPVKIKGMEKHGLNFFLCHDSCSVGAQCKHCHTIVWVNGRLNFILSENLPANIPSSGEEYRKYYMDKLNRFLLSVPPCPCCGKSDYNKFINNVEYPRFVDGSELTNVSYNTEVINIDPKKSEVWFWDGK
jgi:hypothetical protein